MSDPLQGGPVQGGPSQGGRITLAAVAGAHGVTGEVRLKLFGDGPDGLRRYKSFDAAGRPLTLKSLRPGGGGAAGVAAGAIARFAEITDRTMAEALRGTVLTVLRATLPPLAEGEYYHADLIGLAVVDTDGAPVGTVVAVENFGAGDILEIEKPDRRTFMVPLTPAAVPEIGTTVTVDKAFVD